MSFVFVVAYATDAAKLLLAQTHTHTREHTHAHRQMRLPGVLNRVEIIAAAAFAKLLQNTLSQSSV